MIQLAIMIKVIKKLQTVRSLPGMDGVRFGAGTIYHDYTPAGGQSKDELLEVNHTAIPK